MANEALYGTDVAALDDLPETDAMVSGDLNVAYALSRRLLTQSGAMEEIGDPIPYDSIDVREWMGSRVDAAALRDLEAQATQVISADERVLSVTVSAGVARGQLAVAVIGEGTDGPFEFVLRADQVSATILRGE